MPDDPQLPKSALRAIIIIVAVMALLSLYANIQRSRRNQVETVISLPVEQMSATPTASP